MPQHNNFSIRGLVLSIDRFVGEDGPGIRTTVFLKGCPLRCIWCHSPQSQSPKPQLYFTIKRCIGCGKCVQLCPQGAQVVSRTERRLLWEKCDNCGKCAEGCPSTALEISGRWLTVNQVMDIVKRDFTYYKNSCGGVTFSGGEPLAQPEFLRFCLKGCQQMGIHTAIDTSGYAHWSVFEAILPFTDLFLYDLKHMDSAKHRQFTGVGNELILENLKRVVQHKKKVWIRLPLIPGYNDTKKNIRSIAGLIKRLKAVEKVSLLPYNAATGAKYACIGKILETGQLEVPYSLEKMGELAQVFISAGIKVDIGK